VPQATIRGVFMRGGTSKGIFCALDQLPPPGSARDALILELLGSPDPNQLDGMGGGMSSTSKLMAVSRSERRGIDVDYLFAQVSVREPVVDYRGNCGNLTSAIGVYAIDEGLVDEVTEPVTVVELHNENTGIHVRAHVPVVDGRAAVQGDHAIAGVPRPGARIVNEYLDPAGSQFGVLFPTGEPRGLLTVDGDALEVSIVDVSNPVVHLRASDLGLEGHELPEQLNGDAALLHRLERIRGHAAVVLGLVDAPEEAVRRSASLPMLSIVSSPRSYTSASGTDVAAEDTDVCARAVTVQRVHHAYPMTVLTCTAAAARLPGTIVHDLARQDRPDEVRVGHAKGTAAAGITVELRADGPRVVSVSVTRTARRLMAGELYYRHPLQIPDALL
jgi:2-methylaconitate isomerase